MAPLDNAAWRPCGRPCAADLTSFISRRGGEQAIGTAILSGCIVQLYSLPAEGCHDYHQARRSSDTVLRRAAPHRQLLCLPRCARCHGVDRHPTVVPMQPSAFGDIAPEPVCGVATLLLNRRLQPLDPSRYAVRAFEPCGVVWCRRPSSFASAWSRGGSPLGQPSHLHRRQRDDTATPTCGVR